jgi:hypothetical protein
VLTHTTDLSDAMVRVITKGCPQLQTVSCLGCTKLTPHGVWYWATGQHSSIHIHTLSITVYIAPGTEPITVPEALRYVCIHAAYLNYSVCLMPHCSCSL